MQLGPYTLPNALFVAPMAGVTDRPFRKLCKRAGRGLRCERDGDLAARPARQPEDLAPCQPRRRGRAHRRADRRHRGPDDGRRRPLQHRPGRPDHRHQHGLPGQEGVQQMGGLGADAGRSAGHRDCGSGGAGLRAARCAGDAQNAHRLVCRGAQCAHAGAGGRERRRADAHRARPHPRAGLQRFCRARHRGPDQEPCEHSRGGQRRHRPRPRRPAMCWRAPAPTPS